MSSGLYSKELHLVAMIDKIKTFFTSMATPSPVGIRSGLERSYYPELDSLRFFAFLMVFGFHHGAPNLGGSVRDLLAMTIDLPLLLIFQTTGFGTLLGPMIDHALLMNGWIGVNLFFTPQWFYHHTPATARRIAIWPNRLAGLLGPPNPPHLAPVFPDLPDRFFRPAIDQ